MGKKFYILGFFVVFLPYSRKREWVLDLLKENSISFSHFMGFLFISKEEEEFFDYLMPENFSVIGSDYFIRDISAGSVQLSFEKLLTEEEIFILKDFLNYISEEEDLDFYIEKVENDKLKFKVFYRSNGDIIFERTFFKNEEEKIKEACREFQYSDVKIGKKALKKLKEDIMNSYLSGFEIDFENYRMIVEKTSDENFSVIFENNDSLKRVVIKNAKINEKTGLVSFAGEGGNTLFF